MSKPLAKALHTVTVLTRLGRHIMDEKGLNAQAAMTDALMILGYDWDCADKNGCVEKAVAALIAEETATLAEFAGVAATIRGRA